MLRHSLLSLLAAASFALGSASTFAGVIITNTSVPTVGKAGYHTFTLTASTNDGSQIQGFDFASLPSYGFFGSMNQVNPGGQPTIFQDSNAFFSFVGADVSQDSQFKFNSSSLTVPAGFASESATQLRAVFAASTPMGTSVPFVQLAVPDALQATIHYAGQIQTVVGGTVTNNDVSGVPGFGLFVSSGTFNNVDANNPGLLNYTFQVSAEGPYSVSDFSLFHYTPAPGAGPLTGPAHPATFDPATLAFSWNTTGSQLGEYQWGLTVVSQGVGYTGTVTVDITKVPEPSSLALCAVFGLLNLSLGRRTHA